MIEVGTSKEGELEEVSIAVMFKSEAGAETKDAETEEGFEASEGEVEEWEEVEKRTG